MLQSKDSREPIDVTAVPAATNPELEDLRWSSDLQGAEPTSMTIARETDDE